MAEPARNRDYIYANAVYGNAVPKPDYEPQRRREETPSRERRSNPRVGRNRRNSRFMTDAYVLLLTMVAVLALLVCVNYVRLQKSISMYSVVIAEKKQELADLREENNTKYNTLVDSVNMDEIRSKAVDIYGMVYASSDQIIYYDSPSTNYVTQYEQIPEDGVLNQSEDVKE